MSNEPSVDEDRDESAPVTRGRVIFGIVALLAIFGGSLWALRSMESHTFDRDAWEAGEYDGQMFQWHGVIVEKKDNSVFVQLEGPAQAQVELRLAAAGKLPVGTKVTFHADLGLPGEEGPILPRRASELVDEDG